MYCVGEGILSDTMLFQQQADQSRPSHSFTDDVWQGLEKEWKITPTAPPYPLEAHGRLAHLLAEKLGDTSTPFSVLFFLFKTILQQTPSLLASAAQDLHTYAKRDGADQQYITSFLYSKGFQATQGYRLAHILWKNNQPFSARHLQSRIAEVMGIDVHPAATIGDRLILGPGSGIVIGETTLIENDVTLMSDVTLGGTGKHTGKRHPTLRQGTLVGPGAQILGPIEVGEGAKIGAGAVVVKSVSPFTAVAGNPARYVNSHASWPVLTMDLTFPSIDYFI